jgi:hypothetical protein
MVTQKLQIIEKIMSLPLENTTIEEIMVLIGELLNEHTLITFFTSDLVLYRGIQYSYKPKNYEALIYPPKDKAKLNRASIKGEQVFYASTKKKAVFYELGAKPDDTFVLSTWMIALPLLISNIGYTSENLEELGAQDKTPLYNSEDSIHKIKDKTEYDIISNYLSKTFSQPIRDEKIYNLTIAIARRLIGEVVFKTGSDLLKEFDGLMYPTIKYNANADNVVLRKNAIDFNKLSIDRVEYIKIIDCIDNKYRYKILDVSDSIDDNLIVWKDLSSTWTVSDESDDIYFENNKAFTELGDEIQPDK